MARSTVPSYSTYLEVLAPGYPPTIVGPLGGPRWIPSTPTHTYSSLASIVIAQVCHGACVGTTESLLPLHWGEQRETKPQKR